MQNQNEMLDHYEDEQIQVLKGLDAVRNEPISEDNPLLSAKNCFITPHISWTAVEGRQRLASQAIGNVKAFLDGAPTNIVNEE